MLTFKSRMPASLPWPQSSVCCWLVCCALSCIVGCSAQTTEIGGKVLYDNQPVQDGSIRFEPVDKQSGSFGGPIKEGNYLINVAATAIRPTKYLVRIDGMRKTGKQVPAGPPEPDGTLVDEIESYIPATYNTASTLTRDLTAGLPAAVDFDLPRSK